MGIKHFWGWFKKNFGKNIKNLKKSQNFETVGVSVDNLMIDCNGLFHSSTQKIYEYGSHKPKARLMGNHVRRKRLGSLKEQTKVFEDVCKNIDSIFKLVNPKKRLILCVDGPAPLAKQSQQRQRRFKSAMEKDDDEFIRFDSNSLTPGTKFMDLLTKYIDWYIRKKISEDPGWKNIEVTFSDEKVVGEGEQKCINYIRDHGDPNDSYCIHGLDADLIMLALGTHLPNFWIIREDLYDPRNEFFVIDIGTTRTELARMMDWTDQLEEKNPDEGSFIAESAVNDFIFICFMVGNDFLPHIPSLEIIEGGIDQMLDVYKNVGNVYGHLTHTIEDKVIFRKISLEVFLGTIAQYDKGILEDKLLHKDQFFPDLILEKNATLNKGKYTVDIDGLRKDYYKESFTEGSDIKDLCHQYFEGMQWVLSYYTRGVPDWKWCFKHHYAPFAHELAENITDFEFPEKRKTVPATPFQQLLSVLPPKSSALIPIPLSQLLTDSRSGIKKFCPAKFKVDVSGKRREWEGIVLLPMVDFSVIEEEYSKHIDKVDQRDLVRNVVGDSYVYTRSLDKPEIFRSFYGDIPECIVNSKVIDIRA
jgi:5'-3' exoribonuclease 1